jgi:hypothetical protein
MIEFFTVAPEQDPAFLAAWAEAAPAATLYRALRADSPHRFAALATEAVPERAGGVLLLVRFDTAERDRLAAAWEPVREAFARRQGFLAANLHEQVAVVHWSSPLMYARTVQQVGDLIAAIPFRSEQGLYVPA